MKARLGLRVFALLAVLNLVVFTGLGAFLSNRLEQQRSDLVFGLTEQTVATLEGTILPEGELNVARILDWPGWRYVSDAVLVDANLERAPSGRLWPRGVALHPVGQAKGPQDRSALFEGLDRCIRDRRSESLLGGLAVPIVVGGRAWGALWFVPREDETRGDL
ncbi:MAG: hypothetical protein R3F34_07350 [Planctomycetota bacterium]